MPDAIVLTIDDPIALDVAISALRQGGILAAADDKTLDTFIDQLRTAASDAEESRLFEQAWTQFAANLESQGSGATANDQARAGFTDGWVRARRCAGLRTHYLTQQEVRDGWESTNA